MERTRAAASVCDDLTSCLMPRGATCVCFHQRILVLWNTSGGNCARRECVQRGRSPAPPRRAHISFHARALEAGRELPASRLRHLHPHTRVCICRKQAPNGKCCVSHTAEVYRAVERVIKRRAQTSVAPPRLRAHGTPPVVPHRVGHRCVPLARQEHETHIIPQNYTITAPLKFPMHAPPPRPVSQRASRVAPHRQFERTRDFHSSMTSQQRTATPPSAVTL